MWFYKVMNKLLLPFVDSTYGIRMSYTNRQELGHFLKYFCTVSPSHDTCDSEEMKKFSQLACEWWKPNSQFSPLIALNALRIPFIRDGLLSQNRERKYKMSMPLENFRILDVGCGGGFLSEPLSRLGASVVGIDPNPDGIEVAIKHASLDDNLKDRLTYKCATVEELVETDTFDAIVCSEVIEHVNNPKYFIENCVKLVKQNGSLFFTTVNKTVASYVGAIIFAEYIAKFVPTGTHDWNKFISPTKLQKMLESEGCEVQIIHGMLYNNITGSWTWIPMTNISYAMHAVKV